MKVIIFGATGMVGQGVLRECLLAGDVESVLAVGRTTTGVTHPKLRELIHRDFTDFSGADLAGYDACLWCLGVSSVGMKEPEYTRITQDYTLAAARPLAAASPDLRFLYVSGAGTDTSESGRTMWARVKGRTENAVLALFPEGYAVRPGFIQPEQGIRSKTRFYRVFYALSRPLFPLLRQVLKDQLITTGELGRAMLALARDGSPKRILESADLKKLGTA